MLRQRRPRMSKDFIVAVGTVFGLFLILFALPFVFSWKEKYNSPQARLAPFTVTVYPKTETIIEDPAIEATLEAPINLSATVLNVGNIFEKLSETLSESSVYGMLASVGIPSFVIIEPGFRKEEVALAFAKALKWDKETQTAFLRSRENDDPFLSEGHFSPGLYSISGEGTEMDAQMLTNERFKSQILSRYSTSTAEIVPLEDALIIASMIQRETGDKEEMRMISGIIWNRIFSGMALQLDATLQYAKANKKTAKQTDWWPVVYPRDKYISSPYNTYQNVGLPPAPISNPSVSAVIAALNPKKTDCLFYFHDRKGEFHCTETYKEHVALLKKYFGRGK